MNHWFKYESLWFKYEPLQLKYEAHKLERIARDADCNANAALAKGFHAAGNSVAAARLKSAASVP